MAYSSSRKSLIKLPDIVTGQQMAGMQSAKIVVRKLDEADLDASAREGAPY